MSKRGGEVPTKGVMGYAQPQGPKNMGVGVGANADIYNQGSQGPTPCDNDESGMPGLGGDNCGMGTNRRG